MAKKRRTKDAYRVIVPKAEKLSPTAKRQVKRLVEQVQAQASEIKDALFRVRKIDTKAVKKARKSARVILNRGAESTAILKNALLANSRKPARDRVKDHNEQLEYAANRAATAVVGTGMSATVSGGVYYGGNLIIYDVAVDIRGHRPFETEQENTENALHSIGEAVTDLELAPSLLKSEWVAISMFFSFTKENYDGGKHDEGFTRNHKRLGADKTRLTLYAQRVMVESGLALAVSQAVTLAERMHDAREDAQLDRIVFHLQWNSQNVQPAGLSG